GLEALLRVFLEASPHCAIERARHLIIQVRQVGRVFFEDGGHRIGRSVSVEGRLATKHLVQNSAESEQIGTHIGSLTANLLRRHVSDRAQYDTRLCVQRRSWSTGGPDYSLFRSG